MAQTAERIGLDSIWIGDHLLYRYPGEPTRGPWEAWSLLAALAAVTSRVEFGPLVACLGFHNPTDPGEEGGDGRPISGGRLVLGVGAGWHRPEYDAYGIPFDHRASRFEEAFTIVRELLRTGVCDFHGTFYTVDDCVLLPRGTRAAGPPLVVGSFGDRLLGITLPHVDGWNAWYADYGNTREGLVALLAKIDAACEAVGREPATLEKSIAPAVSMRGGVGRPGGDPAERQIEPISGEPERLAATCATTPGSGSDMCSSSSIRLRSGASKRWPRCWRCSSRGLEFDPGVAFGGVGATWLASAPGKRGMEQRSICRSEQVDGLLAQGAGCGPTGPWNRDSALRIRAIPIDDCCHGERAPRWSGGLDALARQAGSPRWTDDAAGAARVKSLGCRGRCRFRRSRFHRDRNGHRTDRSSSRHAGTTNR